ncbi:MAG: outer membrane lipoprotein chaperone LolA [Lautropia sp.]
MPATLMTHVPRSGPHPAAPPRRRLLTAAIAAPVVVLPAASRWGRARAADSAIAQLRRFTDDTHSARGRFTQQLLRQGGAARASSGEFAFARPGRFRWEIREPYEQLIVTDGRTLWFYDKDLEQVTIREASETIGATPAALLFGSGRLDAAFTLAEQGERDGLQWVEAVPRKPDSGFEKIGIGLRDGLPAVMEVRDSFGQVNRFRFEAIERNPALAPDRFDFTPPPGVDVIR